MPPRRDFTSSFVPTVVRARRSVLGAAIAATRSTTRSSARSPCAAGSRRRLGHQDRLPRHLSGARRDDRTLASERGLAFEPDCDQGRPCGHRGAPRRAERGARDARSVASRAERRRLARELDALEELQRKKVLDLARRLKPGLTLEDVQNPHDFPELDDPDWHYADGVLAGIQSVKSTLSAMMRTRTSDKRRSEG